MGILMTLKEQAEADMGMVRTCRRLVCAPRPAVSTLETEMQAARDKLGHIPGIAWRLDWVEKRAKASRAAAEGTDDG